MLSDILNVSFISGILASIIAALIIDVIKEIVIYKRAPFTGEWVDEICDQSGNVVKVDEYKLKQNKRNNIIKGKIQRVLPNAQSYRKCYCIGVVDGEFMILIFWPIRENNISRVNGCMYLKHEFDNEFKGYYMTEHNEKIDMTPITLKKK